MAAMATEAMAAMEDMDMERGLLMLMLTTVVDSSVKPVAIMEAMVDLPTPSESALLMPKPTMAVMAMADMEAMAATDTARGPLTPMLTMAVTAMAVMEAMAAMDTARGPLTPMPTMAVMAMEVMEAMVAINEIPIFRLEEEITRRYLVSIYVPLRYKGSVQFSFYCTTVNEAA